MDPRKVTDFDLFFLRDGMSVISAARRAGVGESWAYERSRALREQGVLTAKREKQAVVAGGPIAYEALNSAPKRAWGDFEFFRRRYLGHISTPWQVAAGEQVIQALGTDEREFIVINLPPGAGKSTLVRDIALWATVRNRGLRGLMGSGTQAKATTMLGPVRRALERAMPARASSEDLRRGVACDATATLAQDFGVFRPLDKAEPWRSDALLVVQPGYEITTEKEHTWTAYGLDADYLGDRIDLMLWDDAVLPRDYKTLERIEERHKNFDTVTESRLEPTGVLLLIGQRIAANDLSRHCLDKVALPDDDEDLDELEQLDETSKATAMEGLGRKYQHIVYPAHFEDRCTGVHGVAAKPWPEGCLLDPWRIKWREIRDLKHNDPATYETWYQQKDTDPADVLVKKVWVDGGTDPDDGTTHWPAWNKGRSIAELPQGVVGPLFSFAWVDPSPTKFWAVQWWVIAPRADNRMFLMDLHKGRMRADEFLEWRQNDGRFVGLAEEWQTRSEELGLPITHWVVEHNGAQRFLLQYDFVRRWTSRHGVHIVPHTTALNKSDPKFGVWMVREPWRTGRVDLPCRNEADRLASLKLVDEVCRYPHGWYDDQVMAMWFGVSRLPNMTIVRDPEMHQQRPDWVAGLDARHLMAVGQ